MNTKFNILIFLFLSCVPCSLIAQDMAYTRNIIDTLCSNYMHGRGYTEEGHLKAAQYLANEFEQIGLEHFKKSYFQYFTASCNTFPHNVTANLDDAALIPGKHFLVDPSCPAITGTYNIVKMGKRDFYSEESLTRFLASVSGKWILLDENTISEKEEKMILRNFLISLNPKSFNHAGIAFIKDSKLTWHISQIEAPIPVIYLESSFAFTHFDSIHISIENEFRKKIKTQNIIGYIEGTQIPDSFLVFTAHYDHLGSMGKVIFPGANDNASGISMLLNLARYFSDHIPRYSVMFMALGGEELGLLGASHYVKKPFFPLKKIKFLVNIDLAGTGDEGIQVVNGSIFKEQFTFLKNVNEHYDLLPQVKTRGESCNSDHCPFYKKGVPSFFIYTLGGIKAYHDIYDIPETLPLTEFNDYFKLLTLFVEKGF